MRILSTHIPNENIQDRFVWSESKNGGLNVIGVYAFYLDQKGSLVNSQDARKLWSKFWSSDIIPKWKLFTWRLLNNALATNNNLQKRQILIQESCYLCRKDNKTESYLFRDCNISSRVWACSTLGINVGPSSQIPIGEWIRNFLLLFWKEDGIKSDRAKDYVATLSAIWIHRNNIVFRNQKEHPTTILKHKEELMRELEQGAKIKENVYNSHASKSKQANENTGSNSTWPRDLCIILVDRAWKRYNKQFPRSRIGWAAYMNNIKIFEGSDRTLSISPLQTEAQAMYRGLSEATNKGIRQVQIHSDNADLVRAINNKDQPFDISSLDQDIKAICSKFSLCKIRKVSRTEVIPAHNLAVAARQGSIVT
ncbi:uncharacterized protein LOC104893961 [Beta vulgaris subsp. vulgaris]|uniref:uncharacterized protein LOC104893961 n=1 Tax=Beta vulgaris subsp. vulgaris TaxID=3555 RepID=UPI00053F79F8|nr:uncharacterized protein LOC104893961 [Beta vulgaris subsp. vulgaris]